MPEIWPWEAKEAGVRCALEEALNPNDNSNCVSRGFLGALDVRKLNYNDEMWLQPF